MAERDVPQSDETADLRERLVRAYDTIGALALTASVRGDSADHARLRGKQEGVSLALSYLAEIGSRDGAT